VAEQRLRAKVAGIRFSYYSIRNAIERVALPQNLLANLLPRWRRNERVQIPTRSNMMCCITDQCMRLLKSTAGAPTSILSKSPRCFNAVCVPCRPPCEQPM